MVRVAAPALSCSARSGHGRPRVTIRDARVASNGPFGRPIGNTRTLDAHAYRLRKKLRPSGRSWVVNVRGVGYKLTEAL